LHPDFRDLLHALNNNSVDFVVVGAFALAHLGFPRGTGDLDIWLYPNAENAAKTLRALDEFGFASLNLTVEDILSGDVIQLGFPPIRIDLLTRLSGVSIDEVWSTRQAGKVNGFEIYFLSKEIFIKNKKAIGRDKDLVDLKSLGVK